MATSSRKNMNAGLVVRLTVALLWTCCAASRNLRAQDLATHQSLPTSAHESPEGDRFIQGLAHDVSGGRPHYSGGLPQASEDAEAFDQSDIAGGLDATASLFRFTRSHRSSPQGDSDGTLVAIWIICAVLVVIGVPFCLILTLKHWCGQERDVDSDSDLSSEGDYERNLDARINDPRDQKRGIEQQWPKQNPQPDFDQTSESSDYEGRLGAQIYDPPEQNCCIEEQQPRQDPRPVSHQPSKSEYERMLDARINDPRDKV